MMAKVQRARYSMGNENKYKISSKSRGGGARASRHANALKWEIQFAGAEKGKNGMPQKFGRWKMCVCE